MTALNAIERREWAVPQMGRGTTDFVVIARYSGALTFETVKKSFEELARLHQTMRYSIELRDRTPVFVEKPYAIPLTHIKGEHGWCAVVDEMLEKDFSTGKGELLWKATWAEKDETHGAIYLKFHHVVTDGVGAAEAVNHLFMIINGESPTPPPKTIDLQPLFDQITGEGTLQPPLEKGDAILRSSQFVDLKLTTDVSEKVLSAAKSNQIRVHALLFSALILAWQKVAPLSFEELYALTVVNCRNYFFPPASKEMLRSLFTFLYLRLNTSDRQLLELAREIDTKLHARLNAGEHFAPLSDQSAEQLSPEEFSEKMQLPQNMLCVTNVGRVSFQGIYPNHQIDDLFFVPAVHPYFNKPYQGTMSVTTLRGQIHLAFSSVRDLTPPQHTTQILSEMNTLLSQLV